MTGKGGLIIRHLKTSFAGNSWPSAVDIPEKAIPIMTSNNDNHFNYFIQKSNYFFLSFCKECLQILACTIKTIFTCWYGIGHNGLYTLQPHDMKLIVSSDRCNAWFDSHFTYKKREIT